MNVYQELEQEREYQKSKWGIDVDDTLNTPWMWSSYIAQYATRWMRGEFLPVSKTTTDSFRECMVKVATLAIAAIESVDRQRRINSNTFFEKAA